MSAAKPRGTIVVHDHCLHCGRSHRLTSLGARIRVLARYDHRGHLCGRCSARWYGGAKQHAQMSDAIRCHVRELEGEDA